MEEEGRVEVGLSEGLGGAGGKEKLESLEEEVGEVLLLTRVEGEFGEAGR